VQIAVASDVLRSDVYRLVVGQLILTAGLSALILHRIRTRTTDRSTLYFGIASLLYAFRLIVELQMLRSTFPSVPWDVIHSSITLVIGVPFALYLGSTLGRAYPWFTRGVVIAAFSIGALGGVRLIQHAPMDRVWFLNGLITVASLVGWLYIGFFPKIPIDREVRALRIGLLVLGLFAFFQNLSVMHVLPELGFFEPLGMVFLFGTFLYVSVSRSLRMETSLIAIRSELAIARQIQSALLPKLDQALAGVEIHARYSPAGSVAGDFYDVLTDGRGLGVLIADVSGHGVPAALSASMLKVALRAQAQQAASPAEVMEGLNRTLGGMLGSQFITAAYVYIDADRQELRYSGAGHPPLLLWRFATRKVESIEQNGLFLGPFPQAEYSAVCSRFDRGDRCLLYTDGVLEASNNKEEEFGSVRLSEFLAKSSESPANTACSALLDQVTTWFGGEPDSQQDDITFVLIQF
jgi:sigma-B regulation protein RsbU (phosphoserine phosphatase)